ncbi:DUF3099 domain-containing protein [Microbacterium sp. ARD32]|uniref:DUF3099 domain-containing protein n=1 Tax=Microbacterium sp. ARD32 TaxID=2962577 RepID=UPI002881E3DE|nr:DUF3099 domain-containing protein [Microbacterium sp. ARD32]MDT0157351.1 DUF3099 domain-containing protein [Microbacterium sp. ARD32]
MKSTRRPPSVTSLPEAPQDEARRRVRRYAITMGIRTVCFILMAVIQPIGWWTFAFAAGAIFLPYIAVVAANAGADSTPVTVESPALELEARSPAEDPAAPRVITVQEAASEPPAEEEDPR